MTPEKERTLAISEDLSSCEVRADNINHSSVTYAGPITRHIIRLEERIEESENSALEAFEQLKKRIEDLCTTVKTQQATLLKVADTNARTSLEIFRRLEDLEKQTTHTTVEGVASGLSVADVVELTRALRNPA